MAKGKAVFVCNECGADHPRWMGQCPACGGWNCISEMTRILQARTLVWVAISFSRGPSRPREFESVTSLALACRFFTTEPPGYSLLVKKSQSPKEQVGASSALNTVWQKVHPPVGMYSAICCNNGCKNKMVKSILDDFY